MLSNEEYIVIYLKTNNCFIHKHNEGAQLAISDIIVDGRKSSTLCFSDGSPCAVDGVYKIWQLENNDNGY